MGKLVIKDLYVSTSEGYEILKGVSLEIGEHEKVALLGPNGHGKSTLFNAIMGNPKYVVTSGSIEYDGKDVLAMSVDERSKAGLFLGMQNPCEIPGVINAEFLKAALNARSAKPVSFYKFYNLLNSACNDLKFQMDMTSRSLNDGFSGGEKKRNEILQMRILNPEFVMLDEIDSGLDVDAINLVSAEINKQYETTNSSLLVISHYARLYDLINPTKAVVIVNGKIATIGGPEVIQRIDKEGYEWIEDELGISIKKEEKKPVLLETCAVKDKMHE